MKQIDIPVKRNVKTFYAFDAAKGKDLVERKAKVTFLLPETVEETRELLGDKLEYWALQGMVTYLRQRASARLGGVTSGSTEDKKLMRMFGEGFRAFVRDAGMEKQEALESLLKKPRYANIADAIRELVGTTSVDIDYTTEIPTPTWFTDIGELVKSLSGEEEETPDDDS